MKDLVEQAANFLLQHMEPELCNAVVAQANEIERLRAEKEKLKVSTLYMCDEREAEIERLKRVVDMQGETLRDYESEIDKDKTEIERLKVYRRYPMKFEIDDELVDKIVSKFCTENIPIMNDAISRYSNKTELKSFEKEDLADAIMFRKALIGVYNYCNHEKWNDGVVL